MLCFISNCVPELRSAPARIFVVIFLLTNFSVASLA
ncbi:hypothetical protein NB688_003202 [Xanthomonas sacchari]|uniref:Uncharacterized protein n=1 Tax=Xanthomonas sacchari TaxID=56458 RepID=A0ABT3DYB8_9XANT|nr:hypothetical protein [Xanthomonas sacchari]MCW0421036.1 hypothetical protein [Xanthomonas sacchari]